MQLKIIFIEKFMFNNVKLGGVKYFFCNLETRKIIF